MKTAIETARYTCDVCGTETIGDIRKLPPGWSEPSIKSPLNFGTSITSAKHVCPECSKAVSDAHFKAMYPNGITVVTGNLNTGTTVSAGGGR